MRKGNFAMEAITARPPKSNHQLPPDPIPDDFDPAATPIISRHFFGVEPFGQVGTVADLGDVACPARLAGDT